MKNSRLRARPRARVLSAAELIGPQGMTPVLLVDLSQTGVKIKRLPQSPLKKDRELFFAWHPLPGLAAVKLPVQLKWEEGEHMGFAFGPLGARESAVLRAFVRFQRSFVESPAASL